MRTILALHAMHTLFITMVSFTPSIVSAESETPTGVLSCPQTPGMPTYKFDLQGKPLTVPVDYVSPPTKRGAKIDSPPLTHPEHNLPQSFRFFMPSLRPLDADVWQNHRWSVQLADESYGSEHIVIVSPMSARSTSDNIQQEISNVVSNPYYFQKDDPHTIWPHFFHYRSYLPNVFNNIFFNTTNNTNLSIFKCSMNKKQSLNTLCQADINYQHENFHTSITFSSHFAEEWQSIIHGIQNLIRCWSR